MIIRKNSSVAETQVQMEGARDVTIQILIGNDEGSGNIVMRRFKILPGGHTPKHRHDFEHVIKVLSGKGKLEDGEGKLHDLSDNNSAFVAPDEIHQFTNPFDVPFEFLCIIPNRG